MRQYTAGAVFAREIQHAKKVDAFRRACPPITDVPAIVWSYGAWISGGDGRSVTGVWQSTQTAKIMQLLREHLHKLMDLDIVRIESGDSGSFRLTVWVEKMQPEDVDTINAAFADLSIFVSSL